MPDKDKEESTAPGFRDPPIDITRACLSYMGRVMESREFFGFYFNFVKSSEKLAPLVAGSQSESADFSEESLRLVRYNFSKHRQLVNELMLSRAVESFDLYVLNILRNIIEAKPQILKSKSQVDAATLIELRTPEEIIYYLAERQLNELGYKPLSELRKWILRRTGLELFRSDEIFDVALLATEIRNLIAHNDCMANEIIMNRIGERSANLDISELGKVRISDEWLRKTCYTLDGVVFDFDQAAGDKFDIYRSNRFGAFFLRE